MCVTAITLPGELLPHFNLLYEEAIKLIHRVARAVAMGDCASLSLRYPSHRVFDLLCRCSAAWRSCVTCEEAMDGKVVPLYGVAGGLSLKYTTLYVSLESFFLLLLLLSPLLLVVLFIYL